MEAKNQEIAKMEASVDKKQKKADKLQEEIQQVQGSVEEYNIEIKELKKQRQQAVSSCCSYRPLDSRLQLYFCSDQGKTSCCQVN